MLEYHCNLCKEKFTHEDDLFVHEEHCYGDEYKKGPSCRYCGDICDFGTVIGHEMDCIKNPLNKGALKPSQVKYLYKDKEQIEHPKHYTNSPSGIECIEITEHLNFCLGNAIKYIWRIDSKGNDIENLEKSIWYLNREIKRRKNTK